MPKCLNAYGLIYDYAGRICHAGIVNQCAECPYKYQLPVLHSESKIDTDFLCPSCFLKNRAKRKERKK